MRTGLRARPRRAAQHALPPERHRGYAVQVVRSALAPLVTALLLTFRKMPVTMSLRPNITRPARRPLPLMLADLRGVLRCRSSPARAQRLASSGMNHGEVLRPPVDLRDLAVTPLERHVPGQPLARTWRMRCACPMRLRCRVTLMRERGPGRNARPPATGRRPGHVPGAPCSAAGSRDAPGHLALLRSRPHGVADGFVAARRCDARRRAGLLGSTVCRFCVTSGFDRATCGPTWPSCWRRCTTAHHALRIPRRMNKSSSASISTASPGSAALLAFGVIVFGAFVRLSNAGLSCPDWPTCYGRATWPEHEHEVARPRRRASARSRPHKAWREQLHRHLAARLGI